MKIRGRKLNLGGDRAGYTDVPYVSTLTDTSVDFFRRLENLDRTSDSPPEKTGNLANRLEHLRSLTELARTTIMEADKAAETIEIEIEEKQISEAEDKAHEEANRIISDAEERAREKIAEAEQLALSKLATSEVEDKAHEEANRIISDAEERAREKIAEAQQQALSKLATLERQAQEMLKASEEEANRLRDAAEEESRVILRKARQQAEEDAKVIKEGAEQMLLRSKRLVEEEIKKLLSNLQITEKTMPNLMSFYATTPEPGESHENSPDQR